MRVKRAWEQFGFAGSPPWDHRR